MEKKTKKILYLILFLVVTGLAVFIARGPYLSDALEKLIISELEAASGKKIAMDKIYLNLFPLFIEAQDVRFSDINDEIILSVKKVKGYMGLSEILSRYISINRLVINEPLISADRTQIEEIIKNVQEYLKKEKEPTIKVKVKVIEVIKGTADIRDDELKAFVDLKGLAAELILRRNQKLHASVKELAVEREGWPKIECDLKTLMSFKDDVVELRHIEINSFGSAFSGTGFYSDGKGTLKTQVALLVESVKRFLNLAQKGEGRIAADGEIRLSGYDKTQGARLLENIFIDLKLDGDFYLQTLMELLKVKEKTEGFVNFHGSVKGALSDISGDAKATLRKGNLFGVDIDKLTCNVSYNNGIMKFEKGNASLYTGTAQANASLSLPVVDFFTLDVKFNSIDSIAALILIGWEPDIPAGKVDGELTTSGKKFNPDGWFIYKSLSAEKRGKGKRLKLENDNILSRIRNIKGTYSLRNSILSLSDMQISTPLSDLYANGTVDLESKSLDLKSSLFTNDISEITSPYYTGIKGRGEFSGDLSGTFDNPEISGKADFSNVALEGYTLNSIITEFSYEKNLLRIFKSVLKSPDEEHILSGKISFPEAEELFDFSGPVYDLTASIKNSRLENILQTFSGDFSAAGKLSADINIRGMDAEFDISGKAVIKEASAFDLSFDSASTNFKYINNELSLKNIKIRKEKSILTAEGKLLPDNRFSYIASSENIFLKDFGLHHIPEDAAISLKSEGYGTFDNPVITLSARVLGGTFKDINMGTGNIDATIKNRDIFVKAALFNEKMRLAGKGYLDDKLPWTAEIQIQPGRYDFIISSILKEVPEDLNLNLEGAINMEGDRKNIRASASINHLTLSLFEQTFTNDSNINILLKNRNLSLTSFAIRSGTTSFRLGGGIEIGKEYDLLLEGSSSLSPLKGMSKKISYLRGDADFVFSISSKWEKPEINGRMSVLNASLGLRDYPTYISSINGNIHIDKDRIILDKLTGKIGGGDVNISGLVYLKAFDIEGFYLEAQLGNITALISKDFNINFSGSLLYKGTLDTQSIIGDIHINRARFRETVEWKTWLLTAKPKEIPKPEVSAFEMAELNIRISGSKNISIDNNIARAPVAIRGDMILKGSISNPIILGRLESTEGYVFFRNNEFRIIYASVDFADPTRIRPIINLNAETSVRGYNIRLNLEGQMEHFDLVLSSTPHIEETDILALLTVGQIGKQLKGLEGGIGAGEATSFITGKAQDLIEERLRGLTGLDRFQFEPYVSKTTGTVQPRVTVSERVGDRLFVTYTTSLGSAEEQILKLEYSLDKNISLVGLRDERGSVGGDIKLRFEFK
ncbi:MAG: translocation/assembly module TamB domain-containing protein [Nitrospirae bacterium]|nr:translocation/assembly module TamB domain-containing protein [Nitrospirota bacterium]